jgi:hypothetical protein
MQAEGRLFQEVPVCADVAADPGVLAANLRALERREPALAARVRDATTDGLVFFRAKSGAWAVRDGDVPIVSRYDPEGEMRPRIAELLASPADRPDIVLAFGTGLGTHLADLLRAFDGLVVVYEPDLRVLRAALSVTDLSAFLGHDRVRLSNDLSDFNYNVQAFVGNKVRLRYAQLTLGAYRRTRPDDERRFVERIRVVQRNADIQTETALAKGRTWFRYLIGNIPRAHRLPDIGALRGSFRDIPVIVVASGPSLTKNLPLLARAKGRACLFCVGTALKKLVGAGIVPDVAIGIESNDILYQFDGVEELSAIHLMLILKSFPPLFDLPSRSQFVFGDIERDQLWAMEAMGRRDGLIKSGGSVATAAFAVAHYLGAPSITLVGQDLALGEGGVSHAEGTGNGAENFAQAIDVDPASRDALNRDGIELVEGYYGGLVPTRFHWMNYLLWFEARAKEIEGSGTRLINATEGGARIRGFEPMPLARVIDEVLPARLPEDPAVRLDRLGAEAKLPPDERLAEKLDSTLRDLRRLRSLSGRSTAMIRDAFERLATARIDPRDVNRRLAAIGKIEAKMLDVARRVDSLITPLTREQVVVAQNCFEEKNDEVAALRNNLNQSHLLHDGVNRAALALVPMFEEVLGRIENGGATDVKNSTELAGTDADADAGGAAEPA